MPLTPSDVANRKFTVTRLGRSGYDETEVDEFLDEVEAELTRLLSINAELQAKVDSPGAAGAGAPVAAASGPASAASGSSTAQADRQQPSVAPAGPPEAQATRILALAQRTADEHVAEAKKEAENLLAETRALDAQRQREIETRHQQMLGGLQQEQSRLQQVVDDLRAFERDYRGRLRDYLQGQLRELDQGADGGTPRAALATAGPAFTSFGAGGRGGDPAPRVVTSGTSRDAAAGPAGAGRDGTAGGGAERG